MPSRFYRRSRLARERTGDPAGVATANANLAEVLLEQGVAGRGGGPPRLGVRRCGGPSDDLWSVAFADRLRGLCRCRAGAFEEAATLLRRAREPSSRRSGLRRCRRDRCRDRRAAPPQRHGPTEAVDSSGHDHRASDPRRGRSGSSAARDPPAARRQPGRVAGRTTRPRRTCSARSSSAATRGRARDRTRHPRPRAGLRLARTAGRPCARHRGAGHRGAARPRACGLRAACRSA